MQRLKTRNKRSYKPAKPTQSRSQRPQKHKAVSNINPADLTKKAEAVASKPTEATRSFERMPLHGLLKQRIAAKGFEKATPIQDQTLAPLLEGRNLMGIANTGTGKTGAFLIPIIHELLSSGKNFQTLILVPTRELAIQVEEEFKSLTKGLKLFSICLIGGTNIQRDIVQLRRHHHMIIGTPGRTLDLMQRKALSVRSCQKLILDEFDRMLDMGFVNDVRRIKDSMNQRQQTILFSATESKKQLPIINEFLDQPAVVRVASGQSTGKNIEQSVIRISEGDNKFHQLLDVLRKAGDARVILFEETKRKVSRLATKLQKAGIASAEIHGNKSQNQRNRALNSFRAGKVSVLVATDVAARGIDVDEVSHVINYQLPQTMDSYIHRIGRTGRAGKTGAAITFVDV